MRALFDRKLEAMLKVLIAEDIEINQIVISEMVRVLDCTTRVVGNGAEALNALKEENFDLVLMDGNMPEMDGYEATTRIRAGEAGSHNTNIPVITISANTEPQDIRKSIEVGMNDFVRKPISLPELANKIQKWTHQKRAPINADAIRKLQEIQSRGNRKLIANLVQIFRTNTPDSLRNLRLFAENEDRVELTKMAHGLKSTSALLGAGRMQALCIRLEKTQSVDSKHILLEFVTLLEKEYELALEDLGTYVPAE